jgi:hypothetical protein
MQEYLLKYDELGPISQADEDTPKGARAAELRDEMDTIWSLMTSETLDELDEELTHRQIAEDLGSEVVSGLVRTFFVVTACVLVATGWVAWRLWG